MNTFIKDNWFKIAIIIILILIVFLLGIYPIIARSNCSVYSGYKYDNCLKSFGVK